MPPKKGRGRGRATKGKCYGYSSWHNGGSWDGWSGYDDYDYACDGGKGKGWNRGARQAWPKGSNNETRDQFVDHLMWENSSSHAWSVKEELANLVVSKVRSDLGIEDELEVRVEDSSRSYDEGGVEHEDGDHVSKSRKVEKRHLHKQRQRTNVSAKLEPYEDLEARMEHMGSLVKGHFDEDPDRAMTRSEWEAIAQDLAKKAADAHKLRRLKKKEEGELRAKAKALAAPATPLQKMAQSEAAVSPIDDGFGGFGRRNGGSTTLRARGGMSLHPEASDPRQ